ncbi:MAG: bifunctional hydroxymethylpyrimidine kinase/phosphomethylpyrimidine kinase [Acidobacteriota bacterium]
MAPGAVAGRRTGTMPRLLTIAGSDSGGGAGLQADLKTFAAHGGYGMSVVTAITAQNTLGVRAVSEVDPDVVAAQIDAIFEDLGCDAVKIGMLASARLVRTVADGIRRHRPRHVVLDPVMVAKSGDPLLADDAVTALVEDLLPLATLITPNLPEAARLTGMTLGADAGLDARRSAGRLIAAMASQEPPAVLVKGGHASGDVVVDVLVAAGTSRIYEHARLDSRHTHGTGCTLSSAIAARLALGDSLGTAVGGAIDYLHGAIAAAPGFGAGHGPVDHFYRLFERPDPR